MDPKISNFDKTKKANLVHKGIIHIENIQKERKYEDKNFKYEYTFSPYTFYPISDKPTNVEPSRPFTSKIEENKRAKRENKVNYEPIRKLFINLSQCLYERQNFQVNRPTHSNTKRKVPSTSDKCARNRMVDNKRWNRPLTATAVTKHADEYQRLLGTNPFKLPISSFKMK